jgi:UDP-glucose 4-epimerase
VRKLEVRNKRVLVTGGAGFLGSYLCENLLKNSVEKLVIVDNFSIGKMSNIKKIKDVENVIVYKKDVTNYREMREILKEEKVEVVFNLAVIPLPMSLVKPKETIETNILIASTLCELLREGRYETLIHTSSSEAYGTSIYIDKPMDESHPTYPITPYAASKLACDHIILSYVRTFDLDASIVRPFNMYGPRQNEQSYAGVIPITIMKILRGEGPIIFGDGLQTRDYSFVEDIAQIIPKFYEYKETRSKIVNLASGYEISIKKLMEMIIELMGFKGEITYGPARPGDVRHHLGDIKLAKKLLNYTPTTDFKTGLQATIDWYKNNSR